MVVARHDLCPHCSQLFTAEFSRYNTHTSMLYRIPQRAPDGTLTAQFSRYNTHRPYYTGSHSAPLMPSAAFQRFRLAVTQFADPGPAQVKERNHGSGLPQIRIQDEEF
jgi:hypothetical protein